MKKHLITSLLATLLFLLSIHVSGQENTAIERDALLKTWYAINVGEPDSDEMQPTARKETFTFNDDGTLKIEADGGMEIVALWELLPETGQIQATLDFNGVEEVVLLTIRELSDDRMIIASPRKATEYSTTPPDPNAPKPRTAPLVVQSEPTIDVDAWSGLYPFDQKTTISINDEVETVTAIGVVILLHIDGQKIVRLNEDGLTTDIEVSKGPEIAGNKHFGLVTEDPELAGEIVFLPDNNFYFYRDKDQSIVEYRKE